MLTILKHTRTGFFVTMAGLLCLSVMTPVLAVASSDLLAGDEAIVTNNTSLRTDVGYTAEVLLLVDAETPASILDGPLTDSDGAHWYLVQVGELIGYLPADSLDPATTSEVDVTDTEATEDAPETSVLPWKEPIDFGVANNEVICRDASSTSGAEIVVVSNGQTIEITGEEIWAEDIAWTPVNCAGEGGFISSEFITIEGQATEGPVNEESVETSESLSTTEASEEEDGDLSEEEGGEVIDEPQALPWVTPIGFAVASDNVICRGAPSTSANEITSFDAGQTVEITGEATSAEGMSWTPVNCAGAGGFVATDFLTTEAPGEGDEETTEEVVNIEEIVEDVNNSVEGAVIEQGSRTDDTDDTDDTNEQSVTVNNEATPENDEIDDADSGETQDLVEGVSQNIDTGTIEQEAGATGEEGTDSGETSDENDENAEQTVEDVIGSIDTDDGDENVEEIVEDVTGSVETDEKTGDETTDNDNDLNESDQPTDEELNEALKNVASVDDIEELATDDLAVTVADSPSDSPVEDWQILGTAEVKGAGANGLACRTGPDSSSSRITTLPEGMSVMVLSEPDANGWMSIVCGDQVGFANSAFLWSGGAERLLNLSLSSIAVVSGTGGGGLNCRNAASINANVIAWFPEGSAVNVRGGELWGWVPVVCGGQDGWVFADYLRATSATVGSAIDSGLADDNNGGESSTGTVTVTGTGGANLNCRTGAGTNHSIITSVRAGSTLSTRGAASGGWQPVTCAGMSGFVSTMYVTAGSGSGSNTSIPSPDVNWNIDIDDAPSTAGFGNGDHARVTTNLNLRYDASMSAGIATYAPAGTVVLITGSHAGNGYYPVNWDGLRGYMHGDYLAHTDQALSERGGSGQTDVGLGEAINDSAVNGGSGSTATGNAIVDYAMGYIGYPYVWATHGPYSFDCSGFTSWVIKNVVGKDIGYGLWTQVSAGAPVSRSNLLPGDLVFFQNTYKAGLSHVGIYIGGGQFVHAQNQATGVVVSDLDSNYYGSRWYGAVRIN